MAEGEQDMEKSARLLLHGSGLSLLDAARLVAELREMAPRGERPPSSPISLCRRVIQLGVEAYEQESRTVSFRHALEESLRSRATRRRRTLGEVQQYCHRIFREHPEWAALPVRRIMPEDCRAVIMNVFPSASTRAKARRVLHAIFSFSLRHGWCAFNPLDAVDIPAAAERPIAVPPLARLRRLVETARSPEHLPAAPALGLMLWAGIRPTELTRLRWADIRFDDRVITVEAQYAKTGGARQVTLYPVLARWLRETAPFRLPRALIVPRAWVRRWRALRLDAGFTDWHPDTLRHTFASYHLKHFRDYNALQIDMGHADTLLLRTRYLGMRGITTEGAAEFWGQMGRVE